ncbi:MAG: 2-succinyl-5-enolpyruvyl-6-hydroxy-3-cyclohexene-1-carboxylic-acid synthase [Paludibacteraceae bacterium]|nr:2-succinyl-5-enolpyruvyl-6-hydroxy-3-cyclohexene-1-carboxylic-acid synthase [Paludibacteraceae bacterium]
MYSNKRNILQLLSLMEQHQITNIVISPGSRNMPLAVSFARHPKFHCHPVTDERSAGFYAIGLAISLHKPVAVCVTSGSALLNLASAVSEAYYQRVPLLVISADRPQAWIGQMDGQTLPQTGVFGTLIKKEVTLPEPQNETDAWYCNRIINEALLALQHHTDGPVHINVPITEPFFECSTPTVPTERVIRRNHPYTEIWLDAQKPIIIVGQLTRTEAQEIQTLLAQLQCPILYEHLANLTADSNFIYNTDSLLNGDENESLQPDLVVYMGGHIVSKRLKHWIRRIQPTHCWRVDPSGECTDTFQCLTNIIEKDNRSFLLSLNSKKENNSYLTQWQTASRQKETSLSKIEFTYSSLSIVQQVMGRIPEHSALLLANSSMVRYAQLFPLSAKDVIVSCNRGINGIDGSLSAAVGFASAQPDRTCFLLIGDLSFFYDMNGLWNTELPQNLRIILINNHGGEIFRVLPGLGKNSECEQFVMAQHHVEAQGWIESIHATYLQANDADSCKKSLNDLFSTHHQLMVAEFLTDPVVDEQNYSFIQKSN